MIIINTLVHFSLAILAHPKYRQGIGTFPVLHLDLFKS